MSPIERAYDSWREDGVISTIWKSNRYLKTELTPLVYYLRDWYAMSAVQYSFYLRDEGWVKSYERGIPVSGEGDPIPWYTYPTISFLNRRLDPEMSVFEYGSGFSTLWFAQRVNEVTGVEHDREWVTKIQPKMPDTGRIVHRGSRAEYVGDISKHAPVDIVVIDGEHRDECVGPAINALSSDGVIILDDFHYLTSDYDYMYDESDFDSLFEDFRFVPFYGQKALKGGERCTAIFYRDDNCLGI